jgi:hypothetical protein
LALDYEAWGDMQGRLWPRVTFKAVVSPKLVEVEEMLLFQSTFFTPQTQGQML